MSGLDHTITLSPSYLVFCMALQADTHLTRHPMVMIFVEANDYWMEHRVAWENGSSRSPGFELMSNAG